MKEFSEDDLSLTDKEKARKARVEYWEETQRRKRESEEYANAPRHGWTVQLRDMSVSGFDRLYRPSASMEAETNGRSIAETIEAMKRSAEKMRDAGLLTIEPIHWRAYVYDGVSDARHYRAEYLPRRDQ